MGRSRTAALVLAVVGLLVSAYLTYEHLTSSTTFACPATATIDCVKVTTSQWSTFLGVPVAILGLAYFVVMTALCLPPAWHRPLDTVRLAGAGLGVVFALYLVYVELFRVDAICLWCTAVHVVTFALFGVLLLRWATPD